MNKNYLAVLDLGSNSFHMVVAKIEENDNILIIDKIKEHVRLAAGLNDENYLSEDVMERAIYFLQKLNERIEGFHVDRVKVVGTDTLRKAKNGDNFLRKAILAIGHPIEIISGIEEARLIYRAVSNNDDSHISKLVIDIGGGSTEVIVGKGKEPIELTSTHMGCVRWTAKYFPTTPYTEQMFQKAKAASKSQFFSVYRKIRQHKWDEVLGTSGTIRAISQFLLMNKITDGSITHAGLMELQHALCTKETLLGLNPTRMEVIAGGLSILLAIFETLRIEQLTPHPFALREGVLFEMVGRMFGEDIREQSIVALQNRFNVDKEQANRVHALALRIFSCVQESWGLSEIHRQQLSWASLLHEVGMSIAFSGYQRHGSYILFNANLPGFTKLEQQYLSFLVQFHRGKLYPQQKEEYYPSITPIDVLLLSILRVSSRLLRRRSPKPLPYFDFRARGTDLVFCYPKSFPLLRPLSHADMCYEQEQLLQWGHTIHLEEIAE